MKRGLILLIGIVLTISSYAQEISLPQQVVSNIIDELIVKDQLSFEAIIQDSVISTYVRKAANDSLRIHNLELTLEGYQLIISTLATQKLNDKVKSEARLKTARRRGVAGFFKGLFIGVAGTLLIILATQ